MRIYCIGFFLAIMETVCYTFIKKRRGIISDCKEVSYVEFLSKSRPPGRIFKWFSVAVSFIFFIFIVSSGITSFGYAAAINLPSPGELVSLSCVYSFPLLKGLKFNSEKPLEMESIVDGGSRQTVSAERRPTV